MRKLWIALAVPVAMLAACVPENVAARGGQLVEEADSMRCGGGATLYVNHTNNAKDLHVRASYDCMSEDTLRPPTGRLVVLDAQNRVVQNQDVSIAAGTTHRGTFSVPGGSRLQFNCPGFSIGIGCRWYYSYSP